MPSHGTVPLSLQIDPILWKPIILLTDLPCFSVQCTTLHAKRGFFPLEKKGKVIIHASAAVQHAFRVPRGARRVRLPHLPESHHVHRRCQVRTWKCAFRNDLVNEDLRRICNNY